MSEIIYKTRGKIKQVVGTLAGKDKLKADGEVDELKGKAQGALEDIKHAAKGCREVAAIVAFSISHTLEENRHEYEHDSVGRLGRVPVWRGR